MSATAADRRDDILRMLADVPDGLSDGDLARAFGDGVRPQTVNTICRRLESEGQVERVGARPIRNRLPVTADAVQDVPDDPPDVDATPDAGPALPEPHTGTSARDTADGDIPGREPAVAAVEDTPRVVPGPDVLQAWSRTVNVQAAVASWLCERGATIRSATVGGAAPARDIVARLGGEELHVEVTGWPPGGVRTHPTTIAQDWFTAAARAAVRRRSDHPAARIVIAVPDTRRYRSLAARPQETLRTAGAEVWFVDPTGAVHET